MAKTLSQLRTMVRQKADIENDGNHISDTEVDSYINDGIKLLHSLLVDGTDGQLFAKNAPVLTKIGTYSFQLPSDFSQLVSVDINTGSFYQRSNQADPQDYAQLTQQTGRHYYTSRQHFLRWSLDQDRAELFCFPEVEATKLAVQYIPSAPVLSLDSDTLNWPDFWYQWVVLDAAVQCSNKEESVSNTQALLMEKEKVERRVRDHIRSMTTSQVKTIRKRNRGTYPYNWRRGY
jgi:hypothetical protein